MTFPSLWSVYAAGEGLEYTGEPLIREESVEADLSGDGRPDDAGSQGQAEEEKEKSPSTDQQTQESEVCAVSFYLQHDCLMQHSRWNNYSVCYLHFICIFHSHKRPCQPYLP